MNSKEFLRHKWMRRSGIVILALAFLKFGFVNYNEPTEIGIARNLVTGKTWKQEGGWHLTWPWVLVPRIDTRPMRVSVDSAGRGYNAKLVQFVPEEWEAFVETEGFRFWWFANRLSFNFGYEEEHRGMRDIMRGYAYGAKQYPFLVVLEEFDEQAE